MVERYLLFVSLSYAYPILRPIQDEIRRRGGDVAWFVEAPCKDELKDGEVRLLSIPEVMDYNPIAVFAPGNYIYDFFPGIKVEVFHGLYYKRVNLGDHYRIRGFFDLYCVTSNLFMPTFKQLEKEKGFFKVALTGWSKFDQFLPALEPIRNEKPIILFAPTFSPKIESAELFYPKIAELIREKDWNWLFSFHPLMSENTNAKYQKLAEENENACFWDSSDKLELFRKADMMLSDSSSTIYEFLWFDKPVVTYRNPFAGKHLINFEQEEDLETSILKGLNPNPALLAEIRAFMDQVHPFRDGRSSSRILDAVDDFIRNYQGKLKRKPLNLFRNLKLRKKVGYFPFGKQIRTKKIT